MKVPSLRSFRVACVAAMCALGSWLLGPQPAHGAATVEVPPELAPWVPWVLADKPEHGCPLLASTSERVCAWPSEWVLRADDRGASFSARWTAFAPSKVPLAGEANRWPLDVRVDGKRVAVFPEGAKPSTFVGPGTHRIEGRFEWASLPETLAVPPSTGIVKLVVRGKEVPNPTREADGTLFLATTEQRGEADGLTVLVHRLVEDGVPYMLTTRIALDAAGSNREVVFGKVLPKGFVPLAVRSPLPARLDADGQLRVQVRAGSFVTEIVARSSGPVQSIERPTPEGPWREGEEIWAFRAAPSLRVVEVEGLPSIDPSQTTLPAEWKQLPTYPLAPGAALKLVERRRGDASPPADQLRVRRKLWLDFDGEAMTASDLVEGSVGRARRLEALPPMRLGRVAIGGRDQFITHTGDPTRTGVELRQGPLRLSADSRIQASRDLPAVGFDEDFTSVDASLYLPPGYRLVHASGVDDVPESWLRHFTLLEIFLILVLALGTARLFGKGWGALALVTLTLSFPEVGAPKYVWVFVLIAEALRRLARSGWILQAFRGAKLAAAVGLIAILVPFLVQHVREGLHPALRAEDAFRGDLLIGAKSAAPSESFADGEGRRGDRDEEGEVAVAQQGLEAAPSDAPPPPPAQAPTPQQPTGKSAPAAPEPEALNDNRVAARPRSKSSSYQLGRQQNTVVEAIDPNAMIQTGPGLPAWEWSRVSLRYSGPVERSQRLRLWLAGPKLNLALSLLRCGLLVALALQCLTLLSGVGRWLRIRGTLFASVLTGGLTAVAFFGALSVLAPTTARADFPPKDLVTELERRLTAQHPCAPQCTDIERVRIEAEPGRLRLTLSLHAAVPSAIPLPHGQGSWTAGRIAIDGAPAALVRRGNDLFVAVPEGAHDVVLEALLETRDSYAIALPTKPRRVDASIRGFRLDGLHADGSADDGLTLTPLDLGAGDRPSDASTLPPFLRVERTLRLGLSWRVETTVVRASPLGVPVTAEVPLLPGESVTTADVRTTAGRVAVSLAPSQEQTSWVGTLEPRDALALVAGTGSGWSEVWQLDASPIWHVDFEGVPPIEPTGLPYPEWRPWPGESVTLRIRRPDGVPGQTLTVDRSDLTVTPGLRVSSVDLTVSLRASRGGQHSFELPEGAVLEELRVGSQRQPLRQEGRRIVVPFSPGAAQVFVRFRTSEGLAWRTTSPRVDLGLPSVNAHVTMTTGDRWVLFVRGPVLGPAVLFWSLLFVLAIVAVALGRVHWAPAGTGAWFLLGIGLSQVSIVAAMFVVGWLLLLGQRRKDPWSTKPLQLFQLRQVLVALASVIALCILIVAVAQGLLGNPEMQIEGNGSSASQLRFFEDRVAGALPEVAFFSVPLLVYRGAMLLWALWLAQAVLGWLRFGWDAFREGGVWRPESRASGQSLDDAPPAPAAPPNG